MNTEIIRADRLHSDTVSCVKLDKWFRDHADKHVMQIIPLSGDSNHTPCKEVLVIWVS